jgi:hypothetical protein
VIYHPKHMVNWPFHPIRSNTDPSLGKTNFCTSSRKAKDLSYDISPYTYAKLAVSSHQEEHIP